MSLEALAKIVAVEHLRIDPRHWRKNHYGSFTIYGVEHPPYTFKGEENHPRPNDTCSILTIATPHGFNLELYGGTPYTLELEVQTQEALQHFAMIKSINKETVDSPSNSLLNTIKAEIHSLLWHEFYTVPAILRFQGYGNALDLTNAVAYLTLGCPDKFKPSIVDTSDAEWELMARLNLNRRGLRLIRGKKK